MNKLLQMALDARGTPAHSDSELLTHVIDGMNETELRSLVWDLIGEFTSEEDSQPETIILEPVFTKDEPLRFYMVDVVNAINKAIPHLRDYKSPKFISAVKAVREVLNCNLIDGKRLVDAIRNVIDPLPF